MTDNTDFILYDYKKPDEQMVIEHSDEFFKICKKRRTIREFSKETIPDIVIENIIKCGSTAPSGANKQPWFFCVVQSPDIKKQIREEAERIEYNNYLGKFSLEMKNELKKLKTDYKKEFLEQAPVLIVAFRQKYNSDGSKNYYVNESVNLAIGIMISAIHYSGLVTLTYTPSPMNFLNKILERPSNESPVMILPVGYPAHNVKVPSLFRKDLNEIMKLY